VTRRILLTIVGCVIATLVFVGAGTLALAHLGGQRDTEKQLREDISQLARGLEETPNAGGLQQPLITRLRRVLHLDGIEVLRITEAGAIVGPLPAGATLTADDIAKMRAGAAVSHSNRNLAWAAASPGGVTAGAKRGFGVLIGTRKVSNGLHSAGGWFLISSLGALAVTIALGTGLARRITRPVRSARDAAHRVADGELSTRLPEPPARHTDELSDLTRSINAMADSLERSQAAEQQFLLSVSHDLRTPLTSIRGYAEAIADGASANPKQSAEIIVGEAGRLERLVQDLLQLGRLRSRQFNLSLQTVDLATLVQQTVASMQTTVAPRRLDAVVSGPTPAVVDPDRLAQVIGNLVSNANRFARTAIVVSVNASNQGASVTVDDDGPGIAPHDLPYVFERSYQSQQQPARAESSSGLGLAIVKELVTAMGGTVSATAAPMGGARIIVLLRAPLPAPI
jgi:signal transduction histidine kinase